MSNPGLTGSLDNDVIKQAKDVYLTSILKLVHNLGIPDVDTSTIELHDNYIELGDKPDKVKITMDAPTNSFFLEVLDLSAFFKSDKFEYDITGLFIMPISGYCKVKMTDVQMNVGIKMTT